MEPLSPVEDSVSYVLYVPAAGCKRSATGLSDAEVPDAADLVMLLSAEQVLEACREYAACTVASAGHLWQQEPFNLHLQRAGTASPHSATGLRDVAAMGSMLCGRTAFGDNVEDEWFIVHLLAELTKQFTGLVAEVTDNDGQFLLIEAAMCLPKWLKPENSEHRVFFCDGVLHVLPPDLWAACTAGHATLTGLDDDDDDTTGRVNLSKVLALVRSTHALTHAPDDVNAAIHQRVQRFPACLSQQLHRVRCIAPLAVAQVLASNPQLVSAAVAAFYTRDAIELKASGSMPVFPPATSVPFVVSLTRCMYAQLVRQKFIPPKCFEQHLPRTTHHPDWAAAELGMKLAVGFQILVLSSSGAIAAPISDLTTGLESASDDAVLSSLEWRAYVRKLISIGYFEGCAAGTALYANKHKSALLHFKSTQFKSLDLDASDIPTPRQQAADDVLSILQSGIASTLQDSGYLPVPEDGAEWIEGVERELERELKLREAELEPRMAPELDGSEANAVMAAVKRFMGESSDFQGVETPYGPGVTGPTGDVKYYSSSDSTDSDDYASSGSGDSASDDDDASSDSESEAHGGGGGGGEGEAGGDNSPAASQAKVQPFSLNPDEFFRILSQGFETPIELTTSPACASESRTIGTGDRGTAAAAGAASTVSNASTMKTSRVRFSNMLPVRFPGSKAKHRRSSGDSDIDSGSGSNSDSDLMSSDGEGEGIGIDDATLGDMMAAMDAELQTSTVRSAYKRAAAVVGEPHHPSAPSGAGAGEAPSRLDDAVNLVWGLMESVGSQLGAAGPASNILGELSVPIPSAWHTTGAVDTESSVHSHPQ